MLNSVISNNAKLELIVNLYLSPSMRINSSKKIGREVHLLVQGKTFHS